MATTEEFFGSWTPLSTDAGGPLRDVPREVAERELERMLAARSQRKAMFAALGARHRVDVDGPNAAGHVGAWLLAAAGDAGDAVIEGRDAWRWAGLAADVSLWLGERIIAGAARAGGVLRWELYTGVKKSTGFQRAVLTGFRKVDDPRYYVDVAHFVASWLELAARRRPARADFLAVIEATTTSDA